MKVAVIGGGYYGCHIASSLAKAHPTMQVTLIERAPHIFAGSSSKHQFRLHMGYHYPRSHKTREQTQSGFDRFKKQYPMLCRAFCNNTYVVSDEDSHIDFRTYEQIMRCESAKAPWLAYKEISPEILESKFGYTHCAGGLVCNEELLYVKTPRKFFTEHLHQLKVHVMLSTNVTAITNSASSNGCSITLAKIKINDEAVTSSTVTTASFDWVINCTYQVSFPMKVVPVFYEVCVSLIYKDDRPETATTGAVQALTVMDGPFVSLYPYIQSKDEWESVPYSRSYTLTSVLYTPQHIFDNAALAEQRLHEMESNPSEWLPGVRELFESLITHFYPEFMQHFRYTGNFVSTKTKLVTATASRECIVHRKERVINILSGKINTLFEAEDQVMRIISQDA